MTPSSREFVESPLYQGDEESLAYILSTANWDSATPSSAVVKLWDVTDGGRTDKSGTMLSGSPSIATTNITTPFVTGLTPGAKYRLEVKFTVGANVYEGFGRIEAEY